MPKDKRQACGKEGFEWATGNEAGFTANIMGDRVINSVDTLFSTWKPRNRYEIFNPEEFTPDVLNHKLVY